MTARRAITRDSSVARSRARAAMVGALVVAMLTACSSTSPIVSPSGPGTPGTTTSASGSGGPLATGPTSTPGGGTTSEPGATQQPGTTPAPGKTPKPAKSQQPGESTPTAAPPTEPVATPGGGQGDPLPACAYKDKPAVGDPDHDWATMVLDTIYRLPADFAPRKLVSTSRAGLQTGFEVIPAVVDDLRDMHEASVADDAEIAVRWAYRSYAQQQGAFAFWVRQSGEAAALKKSARPGHSEHQLGTAIDFRSADSLKPPWDYDDWSTTEAGAWMMDNAWRFGFILSYPKGKEDISCYGYEPWHYRYLGRDLAKQVHDSGETLREFLWEKAHSTH